jgi:hypothetical protein
MTTLHQCKRCGYETTSKKYLGRHFKNKNICKAKLSDIDRDILIQEFDKTKKTYIPPTVEDTSEIDSKNVIQDTGMFLDFQDKFMKKFACGINLSNMANFNNEQFQNKSEMESHSESFSDIPHNGTKCSFCEKEFPLNFEMDKHYQENDTCNIHMLTNMNEYLTKKNKTLKNIIKCLKNTPIDDKDSVLVENKDEEYESEVKNSKSKTKKSSKKMVNEKTKTTNITNTTNTTTTTNNTNNILNIVINVFKEDDLEFIHGELFKEMGVLYHESPPEIKYVPEEMSYVRRDDRVRIGDKWIKKSDLHLIEEGIIDLEEDLKQRYNDMTQNQNDKSS